MGLFTQRPEEPSEWTGLPSEPARPTSGAELLPDEPPLADPAAAMLGGTGISSIAIALPVPAAPGSAGDRHADRDEHAGDDPPVSV